MRVLGWEIRRVPKLESLLVEWRSETVAAVATWTCGLCDLTVEGSPPADHYATCGVTG